MTLKYNFLLMSFGLSVLVKANAGFVPINQELHVAPIYLCIGTVCTLQYSRVE